MRTITHDIRDAIIRNVPWTMSNRDRMHAANIRQMRLIGITRGLVREDDWSGV